MAVGCVGDVAPRRVGGVDLDELLEDLAGLGAIGGRSSRQGVLCKKRHAKAEHEDRCLEAEGTVLETHVRIVRFEPDYGTRIA